MSTTPQYTLHNNAIRLIAQYELYGHVKLGWFLELAGQEFSHRPGNPAIARC